MLKEENKIDGISIIVISIKPEIHTLKFLPFCPVPYELILSRKQGLGYARNWGAKQAKNGFLVFFDDDLTLNKDVWNEILSTKQKQFKMLKVNPYFPSSRVVSIHTEDFWSFGGFNEKIKHSAEDVDFYIRGVNHGLDFCCISKKLVKHHKHPLRFSNKLKMIKIIIGHAKLYAEHGRQYSNLKKFFFDKFKEKKFRTIIISFLSLCYYILRGNILFKKHIRNTQRF